MSVHVLSFSESTLLFICVLKLLEDSQPSNSTRLRVEALKSNTPSLVKFSKNRAFIGSLSKSDLNWFNQSRLWSKSSKVMRGFVQYFDKGSYKPTLLLNNT